MEKFKVTITRLFEYEIEVDPTVWTPKEIREWSKVFFPATTCEDIAKHLGNALPDDKEPEGFGYVKLFKQDGSQCKKFDRGIILAEEDERYTKGLKVKILDEDYSETHVEDLPF